MKKLFAMTAVAAVMSAPVMAQEPSWSVTVGGTSDYVFRGFTQRNEEAAIQASLDVTVDSFYAGIWASQVEFAGTGKVEMDYYAGYKTALGPFDADIGVVAYYYPNNTTSSVNYVEGYAKLSHSYENGLTVGAGYYYSPEFAFESGSAHYVEVSGAYTFAENFTVSGAYGVQNIEDNAAFGVRDYETWNVGASATFDAVTFDLRYHTGKDARDLSGSAFEGADGRVVGTIKYTFGLGK